MTLISKHIIVFTCIGFVLICVIGYFFYDYSVSSQVGGQVNERTLEYIQKQKKEDNAMWRDVSFENANKDWMKNQQYKVGDCLIVTLPFIVERTTPQEGCSTNIQISDPRGNVIISYEKTSAKSFDEVPAIKFRRLNQEEYEEKSVDINGKKYIYFIQKGSKYIITSFYINKDYLLTLTLSASTNLDLEEHFKQILELLSFQK